MNFDLLRSTGPYRFKLEWEVNNVIRFVEWTQYVNPLAATEQDMSPTHQVWSNGTPCPSFNGLSLSSSGSTLLDGYLGLDQNRWFYSVGNSVTWVNLGNQAVPCGGVYHTYAQRTSLYLETGKITTHRLPLRQISLFYFNPSLPTVNICFFL